MNFKDIKFINYIFVILMIIPLLFYNKLGLTNLLNFVFFLIILISSIFFLINRYKKINKIYMDLEEINNELYNDKEKETEDIFQIVQKNEEISNLFVKYRNKFFENKETVEAYKIFNMDNLIFTKININLYSYIPNLFISIGILGTFLGLVLGLKSITIVDIFSESQELISYNIKSLLINVSTSFYTSLYGMYYSIIFYLSSLIIENEIENKLLLFNNYLKDKYHSDNDLKYIREIKKTNLEFYNKNLLEISKINESLEKNDKKITEMQNNINKMVKTFESEIRSTLKLIFNEDYTTSMNNIQKQFIENSSSLIEVSEKNIDALREIETLSNVIHTLNNNIEYITSKIYTKEQLGAYLEAVHNLLLKNTKISEDFDNAQYNIAESFKRFEKVVKSFDYTPLTNAIKDNQKIVEENSKFISNYYNLYKDTSIHNSVIKNNVDEVNKNINKLNDKLNELENNDMFGKFYDYIHFENPEILKNLKDEIQSIKIKYIENNSLLKDEMKEISKDLKNELEKRISKVSFDIKIVETSIDDFKSLKEDFKYYRENFSDKFKEIIENVKKLENEIILLKEEANEKKE